MISGTRRPRQSARLAADAAAQVRDDPEVVGDQEEAEPAVPLQPAQQAEDLRLDPHVECRGGFVGDEESGYG